MLPGMEQQPTASAVSAANKGLKDGELSPHSAPISASATGLDEKQPLSNTPHDHTRPLPVVTTVGRGGQRNSFNNSGQTTGVKLVDFRQFDGPRLSSRANVV